MKKFFWYFMEYFLLILLLVLLNFKLPNQNLWLVIITYLIVFSITTILFKMCIILKELKNYLKLIPLVILNIIYIPFYYNKHIEKTNSRLKYASLILSISIIFSSFLTYKNLDYEVVDNYKNIISDDEMISLTIPVSYDKCSYNDAYDFECSDSKNNLITMVVNYDKEEITFENPSITLIDKYADLFKDKNKTFKEDGKISSKTVGNKEIISKKFKGETDGLEYNFILSSIKYTNEDFISFVIQVSESANYKKNKKELENIIFSISKAQ